MSGPKGTFRPSPGAEAIRGFRRRSFYLFFTTCICWRNGRGKLSPESHKPVGIGDLRASSDSEDWEAPRSKPARHGRDGPLRGRKWLFHEA